MDNEQFRVKDAPRDGVWDGLADLPPVTLAWRFLRAEQQRRSQDQSRLNEELAQIALEVHCLRRMVRAASADKDGPGRREQELASIADRIQRSLSRLDVHLVAPEGETYSEELMDLLDNVAHLPLPGAAEPRVLEVLEPAVVSGRSVVRMGRAMIGVPAEPTESDQ